jgi:anti-sigma B factor antagonist
MSVKLTTEARGKVMLVHMRGKLTLGAGTHAFREMVQELLTSGPRRILLDMADVSYIDSSGLGALASTYVKITNAGGQMKLVNLTRRAHDLLRLTTLCTIFESFEEEDSAVRSFDAPHPVEGGASSPRTVDLRAALEESNR